MNNIHPTAIIADGAQIAENVEIGPYTTIGPHVTIGKGTRIMPHVVIDGHTTLGEECHIFPFASLGTQTQDLKFKGDETSVEIGDRTSIREYVTVNSGTSEGEVTRVGSDCLLMACSHVAHACNVGNGVIMANYSGLAGDVTVEDQAIIAAMSGVHQFARVGRLCMVGGMSKSVKDCPPYMLVDGNPAKVHGINSIGLRRRGMGADALRRLKAAFHILYRMDLSTKDALKAIRDEVETAPEIDHLLDFIEASERGILK